MSHVRRVSSELNVKRNKLAGVRERKSERGGVVCDEYSEYSYRMTSFFFYSAFSAMGFA